MLRPAAETTFDVNIHEYCCQIPHFTWPVRGQSSPSDLMANILRFEYRRNELSRVTACQHYHPLQTPRDIGMRPPVLSTSGGYTIDGPVFGLIVRRGRKHAMWRREATPLTSKLLPMVLLLETKSPGSVSARCRSAAFEPTALPIMIFSPGRGAGTARQAGLG